MIREHSRVIDQLMMSFDAIIIGISFYSTIEIYRYKQVVGEYIPNNLVLMLLVTLIVWLSIARPMKVYQSRRLTPLTIEITNLIKVHLVTLVITLSGFMLYNPRTTNNRFIFYFIFISFVIMTVARLFYRYILWAIRKSGKNIKYCLVIGNNGAFKKFTSHIQNHPELGIEVIGYLADTPTNDHSRYFGTYDLLDTVVKEMVVDYFIITLPPNHPDYLTVMSTLRSMGKTVALFTEDMASERLTYKTISINGLTLLTIGTQSYEVWAITLKRLLDVVISFIGLVILSPILLIISILIKIDSPGPILFSQPRVGLNGRKFKMHKFRSMVNNAEQLKSDLSHLNEMSGPVFKIRNDPRITRVGSFIRKTSLDELPQFINVLMGDMSLVGPRPPLISEVNLYDPIHRKRLSVKPGITCIWQISGRNDVNFDEWMKMDAEYVDNWTLWLDLQILAKTIPAVLSKRGAS